MNLNTNARLSKLNKPNNPPVANGNIDSADIDPAWRCVWLERLRPEESQGAHSVYIDLLDSSGNRIPATNTIKIAHGWSGNAQEFTSPCEKDSPEPVANVPIFAGARVWVEINDGVAQSDIVMNLDSGSGHDSHYAIFQWQRANAPTQPTNPPVLSPTVEISRGEVEAVRDRLNLWLAQV